MAGGGPAWPCTYASNGAGCCNALWRMHTGMRMLQSRTCTAAPTQTAATSSVQQIHVNAAMLPFCGNAVVGNLLGGDGGGWCGNASLSCKGAAAIGACAKHAIPSNYSDSSKHGASLLGMRVAVPLLALKKEG